MGIETIIASAALAQMGDSATKQAKPVVSQMAKSGMLYRAINALRGQWKAGAGRTLASHSQELRVEPILLLDERCARLPYIRTIIDANHRLFTSYYMMSVAIDNNIGSVSIANRVSAYAPNRDLQRASMTFLDSLESYQFGLPFAGDLNGFERYKLFSPEAAHPHTADSMESGAKGGAMDIAKQAVEIGNLSVGQIVNVEIVEGNDRGIIPVQIRLQVLGASPTNMVDILGLGMEDNSPSARKLRVKVGDLNRKDLVLQQDRIDEYRRARFSDKSGYFSVARKHANKGLMATILTGTPSIGAISSMAVISDTTRAEVERKFFGNLDDYSRRQQMFYKSLLMQLMVVNDDSGTATVYTRDYEKSHTYTIKELEHSSKNSGGDLTDMLKSFLEGRIPGRL